MNHDILNVWYDSTLVGQLWQDHSGNIGFEYDPSWVTNGFSISQQLPLELKAFSPIERRAHRFFVNLLPEGNARAHIVRDLKTSDSDFLLLKAIGGECAGALSILPADYKPEVSPRYRQLTIDEVKKILRQKGNIFSLSSEKHRPRLSLAGAQDKCPLYFDGEHFFLPEDAAPSTHILKFEVADYRNIPAYEYFMNKLAKAVSLPVVECELKKQDDSFFLLVKRYDRVKNNLKISRIHQEDFCQALGVGYQKKYQQDGGPSFENCYQLIQKASTKPIIDAENLIKWQIFNTLAGNSDGHAKNLALVYSNNEVRLAPFYDLVCTRAIERIDIKLAMAIGEQFNPNSISMSDWDNLAKKCGIQQQYLKKQIKQIAEQILDNFTNVQDQFEKEHGSYPALQRIQKVVTKQAQKALKL